MSSAERVLPRYFTWLILALSGIMSVFHMYTGYFGPYEPFVQRGIHLSFPVFFGFLLYPIVKRAQKGVLFYLDISLALLGAAACLYIVIFNRQLQARAGEPILIEIFFGAVLILLLFDLGRRTMGVPLPIITGVMVLYTYFGPWMPKMVAHRGADVVVLSSFIYLTPEGIWGIPVAVCAKFLFLFILFGTLLVEAKAGDVILDLAYCVAGKARGGPAKVAVVSSAFFGTISGSSVANVVSTGSFTIPLMKRVGYPAYYAGAIEAVASTGGIIMPPVMGAAAFIMADLMDVNYFYVVKAAILPGILYFTGLFTMIHLRAVRLGLKPMPEQEIKRIRDIILSQGYLLLPAVVLVWYLIILRKSPALSAFYGNLAVVGVIVLKHYKGRDLRQVPTVLINACFKAAKVMVTVAIACAMAGIIIGCAIQTGLAIRFSTLLTNLAGNSLTLLLIMAMFSALILGIGVTASVAYIIPAILVVPALLKFGILPIAANMFCFYFAVVSYITPPVCIAAYAAAGVADSNPFKTGYTATRLGLAGFILPYMFIYNPSLILEGNLLGLVIGVPTAVLGVVLMGAALEGWFLTQATILHRMLFAGAAFCLIKPGVVTDILGISLFALALLLQYLRKARFVQPEKKAR